jgi:HEAT repeat protein
MGKVDEYRHALRELHEWEPYLLQHSGLPGPRGNLELAAAVAEEADEASLRRWALLDAEEAPFGSAEEFLPVCGVVGLGRLLAAGDRSVLAELRKLASDPRWRIREAVAIALQRFGDVDFPALLDEMRRWASGTPVVQRAAVAALCEPRLLTEPDHTREVLQLLDLLTAGLPAVHDRRSHEFRTLRQALGYAWSVAIVALPVEGQLLFEHLLASDDPDIRWVARENLRKKRLERMDSDWVDDARVRAQVPSPGAADAAARSDSD